ncbi:PHB depolymerase family esterase [Xylariales sp. PMI_506]|nr:PHB depolymerase family esterase [Xylariales sp. PMI_506]
MKLLIILYGLLGLLPVADCLSRLTTITGWSPYATQVRIEMQVYLPEKLATSPAAVFALHGCMATGEQYYAQANYSTWAEEQGFLVVYPTSYNDSNCWDVSSTKSLTHDGGSQSAGLAEMAAYLIKQYNVDKGKIYITGSSSGCMMTNIMMAVYPNVFQAGSCYSGVAAGCFAGSPGNSPFDSNHTCANGDVRKTGAEWAVQVHGMWPGYNGTYPRMQVWHGTADNLVFYENLLQELAEWSTLLDVEWTSNATNSPQAKYTKMIYGDGTRLIGYSAVGVGHTVPVHPELDMQWFNLA